jgi:hypothetical protein
MWQDDGVQIKQIQALQASFRTGLGLHEEDDDDDDDTDVFKGGD